MLDTVAGWQYSFPQLLVLFRRQNSTNNVHTKEYVAGSRGVFFLLGEGRHAKVYWTCCSLDESAYCPWRSLIPTKAATNALARNELVQRVTLAGEKSPIGKGRQVRRRVRVRSESLPPIPPPVFPAMKRENEIRENRRTMKGEESGVSYLGLHPPLRREIQTLKKFGTCRLCLGYSRSQDTWMLKPARLSPIVRTGYHLGLDCIQDGQPLSRVSPNPAASCQQSNQNTTREVSILYLSIQEASIGDTNVGE